MVLRQELDLDFPLPLASWLWVAMVLELQPSPLPICSTQEHTLRVSLFFFKPRVNIKLTMVTQSFISEMHLKYCLIYYKAMLSDKMYFVMGAWDHIKIILLYMPFCYRKLHVPRT